MTIKGKTYKFVFTSKKKVTEFEISGYSKLDCKTSKDNDKVAQCIYTSYYDPRSVKTVAVIGSMIYLQE